jgi:O-antigen/teichoic acid export membrane protein
MERLINLCPPIVGRWWRLLEQSPVGGRLARGAFWNLAGTGISRGLTLVSSMVVARMLGKEAFGQLGVIQSTVGMFGVLAGVGMGLTATKHIAEHRTSNPARASRILSGSFTMAAVSGVLVTLLLLATAPWLARNVLASADMASLLRVGTFLVLLGAVNAVQTGALAGFEAFKTIAWVNFWSGLISFPCMLAGAYFAGVSGAVWGMVASTAFNAWLNDRALRRHARAAGLDFRLRWADGETALLWNFSLPSLLSSLLGWAGNWGCAAILVNSAGGYGEMGIVNAANQWRQALLFIPGLVINTLLPVLANEHRGPGRDYERALN